MELGLGGRHQVTAAMQRKAIHLDHSGIRLMLTFSTRSIMDHLALTLSNMMLPRSGMNGLRLASCKVDVVGMLYK